MKLVNGFKNVQEGKMQARGRKDAIPHITLSCEPMWPLFEPMPGFSFFRRRGPVDRTVESVEKGNAGVLQE
ncbi:hypothetical protein HYY27_00440 [bacterium]|nr:hypothetical protein [bacterium]